MVSRQHWSYILAVGGIGYVDECGRLSHPAGIWAYYNSLLTYLFICKWSVQCPKSLKGDTEDTENC